MSKRNQLKHAWRNFVREKKTTIFHQGLRRRAATRLTLPLCLIWAWLLHGKNLLPLVERSLVIWSPPPGQATLKIRLLLLGSDDGYNWLLRQPRCFGSSIGKKPQVSTLECFRVPMLLGSCIFFHFFFPQVE